MAENETELDGPPHEEDDHETYEAIQEEELEDEDPAMLQLQSEVEVMAAELEDLVNNGVEETEIAALEDSLDNAVEALVTMNEAKQQIAALRKDRGFKGRLSGFIVKEPYFEGWQMLCLWSDWPLARRQRMS